MIRIQLMKSMTPKAVPTGVALQQAVVHHQGGRLQEAEQLYRAILQAEPYQADANHNLGLLACQVGKPVEGLPYLKTAVGINPSHGQYVLSYAEALMAAGQAEAALNVLGAAMKRGLNSEVARGLRQRIEAELSSPLKGAGLTPAELNELVVLFNSGRHGELENRAQVLIERYPESGFVWKVLGASLLVQGKEALPALSKASELLPGDGEAQSNLGNALRDLGRIDEAIASYRRALEINPEHAEVHYNLGNTLRDCGQLEEAILSYRRAVAIKPEYAEAHYNLGVMLRNSGRFKDAAVSYRHALKINPDFAEAHNNLGVVLGDLDRLDEAAISYQRAIETRSDYAEAHYNLGVTLRALDRLDAAVESYRRALMIKPDYAEAHNNLGVALSDLGRFDDAVDSYRRAVDINPDYAEAHNNCGNSLRDSCRLDEAVVSYHRALDCKPDFAEAYSNLGNVYREMGRIDEALANCRTALEIKPDFAEAFSNLGNVLYEMGRLEEGVVSYRRALEIKPNYAEACSNLGSGLQAVGRLDEGIASFHRALEIEPDYGEAKFNLGLTLLSAGKLAEGWAGYEHRFFKTPKRHLEVADWTGEDLGGKSILIWGEQGVGDEMMFASIYAEIIDRADRCVIECASKLLPLFTRTFPGAQVVPMSTLPHPATLEGIDYQSAAGSLARWVRPSLESFPSHESYLTPAPERVAYWKKRLAALGPGPKVGFCWRSGITTGVRHMYYTKLDQWGPVFAVPGVHFVNLQYDECAAELDEASQRFGVKLNAFEEVDLYNDLDEAAALTQALDLVITAPTAAGVLAAAVGVPTWRRSYANDWPALGTDHYPWSPKVRLFHYPWNEAWEAIMQDWAGHLMQIASGY